MSTLLENNPDWSKTAYKPAPGANLPPVVVCRAVPPVVVCRSVDPTLMKEVGIF